MDRQGQQRNVGPRVRQPLQPSMAMESRPLPQSGTAASQHLKGHSSCRGWCTNQGQAECCAPQAARVPHPCLPSLCLTLANLSSLFLSSAPSWPPCLPGDFRHPSEHLRSLAFALWPSNSSFSSAAASPQFSATGSTPSHKKANLPGRPLPFAQITGGFPRGSQVSGPWHASGGWRRSQNLTLLWFS